MSLPNCHLAVLKNCRARARSPGVVEDDGEIDDDLLSSRDDGKVAEGEHTADVGK